MTVIKKSSAYIVFACTNFESGIPKQNSLFHSGAAPKNSKTILKQFSIYVIHKFNKWNGHSFWHRIDKIFNIFGIKKKKSKMNEKKHSFW